MTEPQKKFPAVSPPSVPMAIPLARIAPNPANPRKVIPTQRVDALAASIREAGLQNPIKVLKLTGMEKKAQPEYDYQVLCGDRRRLACLKLGLPTVPAYVLDLNPPEARRAAILDNLGQEMNWLELYEAMEAVKGDDPTLSQQALADLFEVSQETVSRNLGVLNVLNPSARRYLYSRCINGTDEPPSEGVVRCLAELGDPERVEKAVKVACERRMKPPQAAHLLAWVKAGKDPEAYPQPGAAGGNGADSLSIAWGDSSTENLWARVPKYVRAKKTKNGEVVLTLTVPASEAPLVALYATAGRMELNDKWAELGAQGKVQQPQPSVFPGYSGETNSNRFARECWPQAIAVGLEGKRREEEDFQKKEVQTQASLAEARARKAENRKTQSTAKTEEKRKKVQESVDAFHAALKRWLESMLGPGPLVDVIYQDVLEGNKADAFKVLQKALSQSPKPQAERDSLQKVFILSWKKLTELKVKGES